MCVCIYIYIYIYVYIYYERKKGRNYIFPTTMSTSKTFIKRDLHKLFKDDLKQLREVKPLGKALLHKLFHIFTIPLKYEACIVLVLQTG